MKKNIIPAISELKIPAEQYQAESCFNNFPNDEPISLMHETERKFIHGLIRFLKPKRILEIGIACGGGTAILLNAIKDFKDSQVISVDLGKDVGYFAKKTFPKNTNWKLFAGKDPSEIIEKIGVDNKFDFCIIDTAHIHPVESLNFLTVFPFLSDNAVVVIHDLIEFTGTGHASYPKKISHSTHFANKLLFDCLCGTKLKVKDKKYLNEAWLYLNGHTSGNIGAIQITKDTKKYIQDVFSMLMFPWGLLPSLKHLKLISNIIKKYYNKENFKEFCLAVRLNLNFIANDFSYEEKNTKLLENTKNVIFYGAGLNCKKLLDMLKTSKLKKPNEMWDVNHNIKNIQGIQVKQPDFVSKEWHKNDVIVITIGNEAIAKEVKKKLNNSSFSKILFFNEYYAYLASKDKSFVYDL